KAADCPSSCRCCRRWLARRLRCATRTRSSGIPQRMTMPATRPASLLEAARLIEAKQLSPVDLAEACLARIRERNQALRAFITVTEDGARADAARAEKEIAAGTYRGALHGIPISIKDLVDVAGTPTTSASNVPARHPLHDAAVIGMLRRAGAVLVGKT